MIDRGYLLALCVTLGCELPIVCWAYRRLSPGWRVIATIVFANMFTHGLLWVATARPMPGLVLLALGEIIVVIVEALFYRMLLGGSCLRAFLTAFVANAFSLVVGLWLL